MTRNRATFAAFALAFVCVAQAVYSDGGEVVAGDLRAARQAALQQQLTSYEARRIEADRLFKEAMQGGSPANIDRYSRELAELDDRVRSVRSELEQLGRSGGERVIRSAAGLPSSAPSFTSTPSGAPSFTSGPSATTPPPPARSVTPSPATAPVAATTTGAPSFKREAAAGLTPPTITKLDEATEILTRYEDYRAEESGLGRRSRGAAVTATTTAASVAPMADGHPESLAMRREMGRLMTQQQDIGREADELRRQIVTKTREQAALARMDQQDQAGALQREIEDLNQRYVAAQAEVARLQQSSQRLAQDVAAGAVDSNVGNAAEESGLMQMGRAGAPVADDGRFKAGDKLMLIVTEDPAFNGTYEMVQSGVILPRLGRVRVTGMTAPEAEQAIKQALEANYLRQATVTIEREAAPVAVAPTVSVPSGPVMERFQIIYLAGEFITPGPLRIPENVVPTLLQTIIRSGGITPSGDLTRVKLLRIVEGVGAVEEINVAAILAGEVLPTDIVLQDTDIIVIPPFAPVVYVTGNVEKPGTLRLFQDETLTAYAAILRAGGFARFANLRKVYVVRDLGNGEKAHIPLNIKDVQKGKAPDVILQGKDIVVVPERFFSF
jgi:protein involved in polysaccharide export with SLBB domain